MFGVGAILGAGRRHAGILIAPFSDWAIADYQLDIGPGDAKRPYARSSVCGTAAVHAIMSKGGVSGARPARARDADPEMCSFATEGISMGAMSG